MHIKSSSSSPSSLSPSTVASSSSPSSSSPAAKTVLLAGFVAGTCDILTATIVYGPILGKASPLSLLQGITSALIGKTAFEGGALTAFCGLLIHYCIAYSFATLFVLIYPYWPILKKWRIASGLLYGVFAWVLMNMIVLPAIGYIPFSYKLVPSVRGAVILMLAIGLPISLITAKYYRPAPRSPSPTGAGLLHM